MPTNDDLEPIQLTANRLVEIEFKMINLTGIPDEAFSPIEEVDPPNVSVGGNGQIITPGGIPLLPEAPKSV